MLVKFFKWLYIFKLISINKKNIKICLLIIFISMTSTIFINEMIEIRIIKDVDILFYLKWFILLIASLLLIYYLKRLKIHGFYKIKRRKKIKKFGEHDSAFRVKARPLTTREKLLKDKIKLKG